MSPVYRRDEAFANLGDRVEKLRLLLKEPVRRFVRQPGTEAFACFQKIINAFAESPLLGLSALASLVGLFAYAKGLIEVQHAHLYVGSLISAADVTIFAIRLGVPFVLLALAGAAAVFGLVAILASSQRDQVGWYWATSAP